MSAISGSSRSLLTDSILQAAAELTLLECACNHLSYEAQFVGRCREIYSGDPKYQKMIQQGTVCRPFTDRELTEFYQRALTFYKNKLVEKSVCPLSGRVSSVIESKIKPLLETAFTQIPDEETLQKKYQDLEDRIHVYSSLAANKGDNWDFHSPVFLHQVFAVPMEQVKTVEKAVAENVAYYKQNCVDGTPSTHTLFLEGIGFDELNQAREAERLQILANKAAAASTNV